MTKSGLAARISSANAVHESDTMRREPSATSGQTSRQYFVQATTRSSSPISRMVRVALGCRHTTRRGVNSEGMLWTDYTKAAVLGWRASFELTCYSSMYSAQLIDHFEHPRNAGDLADATACVQVEK